MVGYIIGGLGIINLVLLWFQISSGRRWLKVSIRVHRKTGTALVISGTVHGVLAILVQFM